MKKVFVSGCFDMLHSGHVAFFREAAQYGDLYVGIGSDKTVDDLKGRRTVNSEQERLYMVKAVRYVTDARVSRGSGLLDFVPEVSDIQPDVFVVNEDGNSPDKEAFCRERNIDYVVLQRIPEASLPPRSTTALRSVCTLPYRLDLAGTWIDQPYVSKYQPGWALTISLEPIVEYNERSGMSTSTRNAAREIWHNRLPIEKPETLAKILFSYENKPGKKEISGAQDSIGICMPGLNRHYYNNAYWPEKIESVTDENILWWLENHLYVRTLWPRPDDLILLDKTAITRDNVAHLTQAAEKCWVAILNRNLSGFAEYFNQSFEAQVKMFPKMMNEKIQAVIDSYQGEALAWKLSGAGGGGYLVLIADKPIPGTMQVKIRRQGSRW